MYFFGDFVRVSHFIYVRERFEDFENPVLLGRQATILPSDNHFPSPPSRLKNQEIDLKKTGRPTLEIPVTIHGYQTRYQPRKGVHFNPRDPRMRNSGTHSRLSKVSCRGILVKVIFTRADQ